jgi:hypothetical protein
MATPKQQLLVLARTDNGSDVAEVFEAHPSVTTILVGDGWYDEEMVIFAFDDGFLVGCEFYGSCGMCEGAFAKRMLEARRKGGNAVEELITEFVEGLEWFQTKKQVMDYLPGMLSRKTKCSLADANTMLGECKDYQEWAM